jgi:copper chaperone
MHADEKTEGKTFVVPGMSCENCERAVRHELLEVPGVQSVDINLVSKEVVVRGDALNVAALRAAIEDAGYEAA